VSITKKKTRKKGGPTYLLWEGDIPVKGFRTKICGWQSNSKAGLVKKEVALRKRGGMVRVIPVQKERGGNFV